MKHLLARITIGVVETFIALTAIGGGLALLLGSYQGGVLIEAGDAARFPLDWLRNTPFGDYMIPALVLLVVVGGSSLIAAVALFRDHEVELPASMVGGLMLAGYISAEIMLLGQGISWIEGLYLGLGLLIFVLAACLWWVEQRSRYVQIGRA